MGLGFRGLGFRSLGFKVQSYGCSMTTRVTLCNGASIRGFRVWVQAWVANRL